MFTIGDVRRDLKDIQYYYSKKDFFDKANKTVDINRIIEKVDRYYEAVSRASIKLLELYISIYVMNNTQETLAFDWDVSVSYIKKLNLKLVRFLLETLNQN